MSMDTANIANIEKELGALVITSPSTHSGSPSPFATPPPELLVEVYLWVKAVPEYAEHPNWWMVATHVCHYWHEIALNTPLLWRDIRSGYPRYAPSMEFLEERLRRSADVPLRLDLWMSDETLMLNTVMSELRRTEELSIAFSPHSSAEGAPEGISDAPILRTLRLARHDTLMMNLPVPLVSHKLPLKFLESIHFSRYPYSSVSPFFRPTLKHLSLDNCLIGLGYAEALLHSLGEMPLLEALTLTHAFDGGALLPAELPTPKLPFLQRLRMIGNDYLSSAKILDHVLFPTSAFLDIEGDNGSLLDSGRSAELTAAVVSKAAGHGLLGTAIPVHTLHVRITPNDDDLEPFIYMWTDDPSTYAADKPYMPPIPSTDPFCRYTPLCMSTACNALHDICLAAPHDLGSIRTLIVSHFIWETPWNELRVPERFWSDSFRSLTGLESLYLSCIVWDDLGTPQDQAAGGGLPFPHLRLLSLSHISFRYSSKDHKDEAPRINFIDTLRDMLDARKRAGIGLAKLVISNALHFDHDDSTMLGAYVEEIDWDGTVQYVE